MLTKSTFISFIYYAVYVYDMWYSYVECKCIFLLVEKIAYFQRRMLEKCLTLKSDSWAPHSPDLNPPDFFLWGYLKDRVYKSNPGSVEELKVEIRREIRENFTKKIKVCIERNRAHLEHVIKSKED